MPSTVGVQASKKLAGFAREVRNAGPHAVTAGAQAVTNEVRAEIAKVAPSGRLRGVGLKGAKVGAGYTVKAEGDHPTAIVSARGPLQLIERDTKAHQVAARRKKAIVFNGVVVHSAHHPGTHGKHPFAHGVEKGAPKAEKAIRDRYTTAARKGIAR